MSNFPLIPRGGDSQDRVRPIWPFDSKLHETHQCQELPFELSRYVGLDPKQEVGTDSAALSS